MEEKKNLNEMKESKLHNFRLRYSNGKTCRQGTNCF